MMAIPISPAASSHLQMQLKVVSSWWSIRGNLQLLQEGLTSGLYAASGSGSRVRERDFWKEVDDGTPEMLPHFFCVKCFLSCAFWTAVLAFT